MELSQVDVLIVDDDESIRTLLRRSLQRLGLVCTEARDGVEALERLQTIDCVVILLDMMMPRLDGQGFLERFAESRREEQQPVVIGVSASGEEELRRAKGDALHAIVRKPFDVRDLAEVVALCVSIRRAGGTSFDR
jgi:CheY-like chemotaxis protein